MTRERHRKRAGSSAPLIPPGIFLHTATNMVKASRKAAGLVVKPRMISNAPIDSAKLAIKPKGILRKSKPIQIT